MAETTLPLWIVTAGTLCPFAGTSSRPRRLCFQPATKRQTRGGVAQRDQRLDVVGESPQALLRQRPLPLRHRRTSDSSSNCPIEILSLHRRRVLDAVDHRTHRRRRFDLLAQKINREDLVGLHHLALLIQDQGIFTLAKRALIHPFGELCDGFSARFLRHPGDFLSGGIGGMTAGATRATNGNMINLLAAIHCRGRLSCPGIRGDLDRCAVFVFALPARRESLEVLDDRRALDYRDVPGEHRSAVQTPPNGAVECLIGGKLTRLDPREFEQAAGEISRGRAHADGGWSQSIALFPVARIAIEHECVVTVVEGLDVDASVRSELVWLSELPLVAAEREQRDGGCDNWPQRGHGLLH